MHMQEKLQGKQNSAGNIAVDGPERGGAELAYYAMLAYAQPDGARVTKKPGNDTRAPAYIDYIYYPLRAIFLYRNTFSRTLVRLHTALTP